MTERELFEAALDYPTAERARYLDDACMGDPERRGRVDALLARHEESSNFLEKPALALERTGDYRPISEKAGTLIGPYKLLQQIGEGGFGCVFMAEQEKPVRRKVALKIIKPGMDSAQVIARFESERQALALMDHPNIAKVLDAGTTASGLPYFVMELVKGVPITEFCDKNHMPTEGRLKLFIDVCHAIQHAHHKGVIHRDIKPSNVMVTLHDGAPFVKVIDFGVAKATVQKLTERTLFTAYGQMIGTPAYMSPEQAEMSGLDIDTRSDVYSLGVLLYELLTGTTPLDLKQLRAAGYAEIQRLIREEEAPRPSTRMSSLGDSATILAGNRGLEVKKLTQLLAGDLDWVVMKSLDKDRNRRYGTPGNFAEDIDRYLNREAILARPPSVGYKLQKFVQRNKAAALTAAVIAMTLLIGIAGTSIGFFHAERRRGEAEQARAEESKQRALVTEEQRRTQEALQKSQLSEVKAVDAERDALRQAANSGCDVAQQLCDRNSVAQGLIEYGRALKFALDAKDADLEEAIRWNIGAWTNQMHSLTYKIQTPNGMRPTAAFHPAGKLLAVGLSMLKNKGVEIRLHNAVDGAPGNEALTLDGPLGVYRMAWLPGGERLGIYTRDGIVHIWKPGQPEPEISVPVDVGGKYFDTVTFPSLAFNPDGTKLIAGTSQAFATIFDTATGKPTDIQIRHAEKNRSEVWAMAVDWSRDGSRLITGSHSGIARIWDAKTGELIREIVTCPGGIKTLHFSPDGKSFVCASGHGIARLQVWNAENGEPVGPPMVHRDNLSDAEFSPDGKSIAAADSSNEAFIWETGTARTVGAPIWTGGHSTLVTFAPDGRRVLIANTNALNVWALGSEMQRKDINFVDPEDIRIKPYLERYEIQIPVFGDNGGDNVLHRELSLSPDGRRLIKYKFEVGRTGNGFEMIDTNSFEKIRAIPTPDRAAAVYWKPNSSEFVATSVHSAKVCNAATGETKAGISNTEASSGSFRQDGVIFAIGTNDYNMRFYDTKTWRQVGVPLQHTSRLRDSAFSRDGKLVLTTDAASETRLWHVASGKRVGPALRGHTPRMIADTELFILNQGDRSYSYHLPVPAAGDFAEVIRRVEALTGQQGVIAPEKEPELPFRGPLGPAEALTSVGQNVILEMTVGAVAFSKAGEWMYLNSELDYKNPNNMAVAIKYPTVERRKAMGLDRENDKIVGLRVRVTGKVTLYDDAPQIIVGETEQFEILPAKTDNKRP